MFQDVGFIALRDERDTEKPIRERTALCGSFYETEKGALAMSRKSIVWVVMFFATFVFAGSAYSASGKDAPPKKEKAAEAAKGAEKPKAVNAEKGAGESRVATVNGVAISQTEFNKAVTRFELQGHAEKTANQEEMKEIKNRILQSLIDREVLLQESKKTGIKVEDSEVEAQIDNLKKRLGDDVKLSQVLEKWQFTEEQYRENIRNEMLMRKLLDQQLGTKASVSEAEVKAFYDAHPDIFRAPEEVRASHILVKVAEDAKPEEKSKAREKIKAVQQRIKNGEDFAAVARDASDCPSKEQGGDLNFFSRGMMVGPFEEAAFALNVGAVSDVVETQFGYHVIKVTEKRPEGTRPFDQVKGPVEQHLKAQKLSQLRGKYIEELKARAKIETFVN